MNFFKLFSLMTLTTVVGYAQVEAERTFKDFRGHQLRPFDRSEFHRSVSSKGVSRETQLIRYPNPSSSRLVVESEVARQVVMIDDEGSIVAAVELVNGRNEIDLSSYRSGLYFMREPGKEKVLAKILVSK